MNLCYASNPAEAKVKHLDKFCGKDDKISRNYFGIGIDVMPFKSNEAKKLFNNIFKFGIVTWEAMCKAGIEFHMKFHINFS
jgi:hypothetical protein